jgi:ABC-type glutathione transport system ATPase component
MKRAEPQSPPIVLSVTDLRIEAKANDVWIEIVKGVNLTLRRGEVLGLVGESGAGKSTIGLAALGYFRPGARATGGSVRLIGETDRADHHRAKSAAHCAVPRSPMLRKALRPHL